MMAFIKPGSIQRHPLLWGWFWAALTLILISYVRGDRLPNLLIALPIWAVAGAAWGYAVKWSFDRKERTQ